MNSQDFSSLNDQSLNDQPVCFFTSALREWIGVFMRQSMRDFVQFSKDWGISMSQMSALFRLYHTGHCGVSEIGDHLGVTNAAASQMVDRLVQQGLLERSENNSDRRVKILSLTPSGRELVENTIEIRRRWMEQVSAALTPEQQESIGLALSTLTQAARQLEISGKQPVEQPMKEK